MDEELKQHLSEMEGRLGEAMVNEGSAIAEDVSAGVDAVGKVILDRLEKRFRGLLKDLKHGSDDDDGRLSDRVMSLENEVTSVEHRFGKRIGAIEKNIDVFVGAWDKRVERIEKKFVADRFGPVKKLEEEYEGRFFDLAGAISGVKDTVKNLETALQTDEGMARVADRATSLSVRLGVIEEGIVEFQSKLRGAMAGIFLTQEHQNALTVRLESLEKSLVDEQSALLSRVGALEDKLKQMEKHLLREH